MSAAATGTALPDPLYTINETTVQGIITDTEDLYNAAYRLHGRLLGTVISACLFGTFALCAIIAVVLNSRKVGTAPRARCYTLAMLFMFASTAIYWVFMVHNTFTVAGITTSASNDIRRAWEIRFLAHETLGCGSDEVSQAACPLVQGSELQRRLASPYFMDEYCIGTVALTINVSIGDAIVWSRVAVLWPRTRLVHISFALLLLGTTCTGLVSTVHSCQGLLIHGAMPTFSLDPQSQASVGIWNDVGPSAGNIVGAFFGADPFGLAASVLSMTANVLSTCLVGHQAWKHRTFVLSNGLRSFLGRSQVSKAFMLLVEPGACYSIIWAFVVSYQLISAPWSSRALSGYSYPSPGLNAFTASAESFIDGGLVIIIAIYPTVIVLLVALNSSECHTIATWHRAEGQGTAVPSLVFQGSVLPSASLSQAENGHSAESRAVTSVSSCDQDGESSHEPGVILKP